ncbi:homoserine kinase [Williamsia sterculiae]|nr:homoserine kinase [Williamsia sterculiae]
MTQTLPIGTTTRVRVPGSSANLGAGFDCLGLALGIHDDIEVTVVDEGVHVDVFGEAADAVPRDERHLVVIAIRRGLDASGVHAPGLAVRCESRIPHSRGLGSSAAAVVGGLAAASGLIANAGLADQMTDDELIQLASEFEGHPDNAAASVLGGGVVTWVETIGDTAVYRAHRLAVHPAIRATALIPMFESSTNMTRGLLPDTVPRADAVFNVSRAALCVHSLTSDPTSLVAATADRLHQDYRAPVLPQSAAVVEAMRSSGLAASISGAGPTVLVLGVEPLPERAVGVATDQGFAVRELPIAGGVEIA